MNLKWRLSHVRGYTGLGLLAEARHELEAIPPEERSQTEYLATAAELLHELQEWALACPLTGELVTRQPNEPGWWIMHAYATRRARSLVQAQLVLRAAEKIHPANATIQFNLSCYACQLGDLLEAQERLDTAIKLDPHFAEAAKTDPDLAPLRREEALS
jgi:Tfp pilus assembly protein PilF